MEAYGKELIIDIHECDTDKLTRTSIDEFCAALCERIDMQREDLHFWDYSEYPEEYAKAPDHLKGISAIQFITTSNITIHTLNVLARVYLNVFSCKPFEPVYVSGFAADWFGGKIVNMKEIDRI